MYVLTGIFPPYPHVTWSKEYDEWTATPSERAGVRERVFQGTKAAGPTNKPYLRTLDPLGLFSCLVPIEFWQTVANETNRYAKEHLGEAVEETGERWAGDTTAGEILRWHGIALAMALNPLPSIDMYWKFDERGQCHCLILGGGMG